MIFLDLLKEFDLGEKEISIFNYLLNYGDQPAGSIAKSMHIQRSSCYAHLQKLVQLGLVVQITKNHTSYFSAVSLQNIISTLKRKHRLFDLKIKQAETELIKINKHLTCFKTKPKAHFYSGKTGLMQIMENILIEKPRLVRGFISGNLYNFIEREVENFALLRAKQGIGALVIHPFGQSTGNWQSSLEKIRTTKTISPIFDVGMDILIYNNKTTIIYCQEEFGLTIESDTISKAQSRLFDFAWKYAKTV